MTKVFLMRQLFESYYDYTKIKSDDIMDAEILLCIDEKQTRAFMNAIADASEQAFTAGFNTALALMGHTE